MLKSNAPGKYTVPFATSGAKNSIPITPPVTPGLASFNLGFPPVTMEPIASGGIPPFGQDFNGILNSLNVASLWQQAGFTFAFDSVFVADPNITGYPAQALLARSDGLGLWLSTADSNTTNPDATGSAGWLAVRANAGSSSIAVTAGANTPDPSVLGPRLLVITGSIATATTLVLPLQSGAGWLIQNNTTGAGTLTVQGATGAGVTVAQGSIIEVVTNGTNFYQASFNGTGVYLPIAGTAVAANKLATARTIASSGDAVWSVSFDGSANVTSASTIQPGAVTLAKMAAFQANSLMGNPTGATATPQAITLTNGIQFSGTTLGLGAITPSSVSTAGNIQTTAGSVIAPTVSAGGIGLLPSLTQGLQIFWNVLTPGGGRLEYVNNHGGGSGGHYWYDTPSPAGPIALTMFLDATGNLTTSAAITAAGTISAPLFNRTSDIRLKDYAYIEARDISSECPLIAYKIIGSGDHEMVGISAQDMLKAAPQHVSKGADGYLGVDYGSIAVEQSWHNAEEIRRLKSEILELRSRIH